MSLKNQIGLFLFLIIFSMPAMSQTPPPDDSSSPPVVCDPTGVVGGCPEGSVPPPDGSSPPICDPTMVANCPEGSVPPTSPGGDPDGGGLPDGGIPPDFEIPEECRVPEGQIPDPFCMGTPHDESDHSPPGDLAGFPPGASFDDFDFDDFFNNFDPDDFSSFDANTLAQFKPDLASGLNADYLSKLSPDALSGFSPELLQGLAADALAGFSADQIASLDLDVIEAFSADKLEKLLPEAFAGFNMDQVKKLSPESLVGMSPDQLKSINTGAVAGFTPDQVKQLSPTTLTAITPLQFGSMDPSALGALKPGQIQGLPDEVFSGLDSTHLGAFDPESIQVMGAGVLQSINPEEFRKMDDSSFSKIMANFDPAQFRPEDFQDLLPDGWAIDATTGELTPPEGARLNFRALPSLDIDGVDLPTIPDFSKSLGLGGQGSNTVLTELDEALSAASLPMFNFTQENGVLKVKGSGVKEGTNLAFIPESQNIYKALDGATPGLSVDETGKYVLTTPSSYRVPVIAALNNPQQLLETDTTLQSVRIRETGEARIALETGSALSSVANPMLMPSSLPPGIHAEGEGRSKTVTVVHADGTAQTLKPAIVDRDDFITAAGAFPSVQSVQMNADGTIKIMYNGVPLTLQPEFDIEPGAGATVTPGITPLDATTFLFTTSNGDKQKFYIN